MDVYRKGLSFLHLNGHQSLIENVYSFLETRIFKWPITAPFSQMHDTLPDFKPLVLHGKLA